MIISPAVERHVTLAVTIGFGAAAIASAVVTLLLFVVASNEWLGRLLAMLTFLFAACCLRVFVQWRALRRGTGKYHLC
ncbi:hypothetical protein [Actinocatenispora rupis]|uniref:Uncharacterized protein n=1 Tax=Actinocatenispora rupis TaxID=519421 RepID=A0A8J3J304_9ACTN|nr:hypothetical protein [Actinocatenispora rupis]GID10651.1 hypothetical protein Aru02nite_15400 [Actinocatenispora rupis]